MTDKDFRRADLNGARFHEVYLKQARFRMVDFSDAVMRSVDLSDVSIDGANLAGLVIDGVEIAPLVAAELDRRYPVRALRRPTTADELRAAWTAIEAAWQPAYARAAALPPGGVDLSVEDEWSFAQTLRHLVFATDGWLGAARHDPHPFHPLGLPFTEWRDFVESPDELGIDEAATPSYEQVLELRRDRVAAVRTFVAGATDERLAETCEGPAWQRGEPLTALRCLRVIVDEEIEHLRFAERDLTVVETR